MSFQSSLNVSVSGMAAQRQRVNTISENIANANTTRTPQGGPYRRRIITLAAVSNDRTFEEELRSQERSLDTATEVKVVEFHKTTERRFCVMNPDIRTQMKKVMWPCRTLT